MDILPVCVKNHAAKVYKFFYIYTVRVSNLKMFCDFADVEYKQLFQHDNNKLLSLLPALEWVPKMFEALKSYLNLQERCPIMIQKFFESPVQELHLRFVHGLKYLMKLRWTWRGKGQVLWMKRLI